MKNVVLHRDGTFSYRTPMSGRWVRRVELPCAIELANMTLASQCRILDHLWAMAWHRGIRQRLAELRLLEDALRRQREHYGE